VIDIYGWLKVIHVVLAVLAGGASAACGLMLEEGGRGPGASAVLRSIRFTLRALVVPALSLLPIVGAGLVVFGGWRMTMRWIEWGMAGWAGILLGTIVLSLLVGIQLRRLEASPIDEAAVRQAHAQMRLLGAVVGALYLTVIFVMVAKPV